jgi:NAD(P)-dependent dehydrogenase (short-subunit alcohol dehydrogenase family)
MRRRGLESQVMVITGASSGIGLSTAKRAAQKGVRVVLTARDEVSLRQAVDEIRAEGGEALYQVADVTDIEALRQAAGTAVREYGGIDTWVNNAGVSIYGKIEDVPIEDAKRLFDTNYWGVVNGSMVAVEHLREHGTIINIGSVVSERAVPLQGHYSASKHAVKGFTDALRMELEKEGRSIAVCLVKPSSIATPYPQHAKNYMEDAEPTLPPPVYAPDVVARAILHCAEHPRREITVGGGGKMLAGMGKFTSRAMDRIMEGTMFEQQKWQRGDGTSRPILWRPAPGSGRERGEMPRHVMESSMYTWTVLHPTTAVLALAAVAVGVLFAAQSR